MYRRNFAGFVSGVATFLLMDAVRKLPHLVAAHDIGSHRRSHFRDYTHGFSGAQLREMRARNGVGSSHRRKAVQARNAALARRRASAAARRAPKAA